MMSLYDYLGHAAGMQLGEEVAKKAKEMNITMSSREISNPKYTGKVTLYPEKFLDMYFLKEESEDLKDTIWNDSNKNGRNLGRDFGF